MCGIPAERRSKIAVFCVERVLVAAYRTLHVLPQVLIVRILGIGYLTSVCSGLTPDYQTLVQFSIEHITCQHEGHPRVAHMLWKRHCNSLADAKIGRMVSMRFAFACYVLASGGT